MDQIVNNIQLTWKLAWKLKTYRTCHVIQQWDFQNMNYITNYW